MSRKPASRNTESNPNNSKENNMNRKPTNAEKAAAIAATAKNAAHETALSFGYVLPEWLTADDVRIVLPMLQNLHAEIANKAKALTDGTTTLNYVAPDAKKGETVTLASHAFQANGLPEYAGEVWTAKVRPSTATGEDKYYRMHRTGKNDWFQHAVWEICAALGATEGLNYYQFGMVNGHPNPFLQVLNNCSTWFGLTCARIAAVDLQQWGNNRYLQINNLPVSKENLDENKKVTSVRTMNFSGCLTHPYIKFPKAFHLWTENHEWKVAYPDFFTVKLDKSLVLGLLETDDDSRTFGVDPRVYQNGYHNWMEQLVMGVPLYMDCGSYDYLDGQGNRRVDRRMAYKAGALQRRLGMGTVREMKNDRGIVIEGNQQFQKEKAALRIGGESLPEGEAFNVVLYVGTEVKEIPFADVDRTQHYELRRGRGKGSLVPQFEDFTLDDKRCTTNRMKGWFSASLGYGLAIHQNED